jgi:phenylacetate-CoA ligase
VLDEADVRRQIQGLIRAYLEIGYRPTQRYCCIAATPDADRRRYLVQRLGLFQVRYVPAIAGIDEHIRALRAFRPHLLMSYPSILRALAERVRSGGIDDIRPAVIASGAEVLDPQTRALVETVFRAPVRNLYGAIEIGNIAFECERGRLHVNVDTLIPEYLVDGRPAMPGEPAELVVTSLDLFTTPLIRYHLGDIVRPTPALCPCGRGLPVITLIEGRCDERVRLPDGATIPGLHLTLGLRLLTPIREFRITQASTGALQVELVGRGPLDAETLAQAAITIRRVVHDQLDVHIYEVPALERGRSFKLRSVVSYVP